MRTLFGNELLGKISSLQQQHQALVKESELLQEACWVSSQVCKQPHQLLLQEARLSVEALPLQLETAINSKQTTYSTPSESVNFVAWLF